MHDLLLVPVRAERGKCLHMSGAQLGASTDVRHAVTLTAQCSYGCNVMK